MVFLTLNVLLPKSILKRLKTPKNHINVRPRKMCPALTVIPVVTQLWLGCSRTPLWLPRSCKPPRNTPSPDFQERKAQSQTGLAAAYGPGTS